jgi:hypothetical protein
MVAIIMAAPDKIEDCLEVIREKIDLTTVSIILILLAQRNSLC